MADLLPVNEPSFADLRKKFPQYADLTDEQLAQGVHARYYPDMPFDQFAVKVGLRPKAEDPGAVQAALIGAGRMTDRLIKGVQQLNPFQSPEEAARVKAQEDQNTAIYQRLQAQHPVATAVGEAAPMIAAIPATGGVATSALLGAIPGALEYGTTGERLWRGAAGALGGGIGAAAGNAVSRILQPFRGPGTTSATRQAAEDAAQRLGVELTPAERSGSTVLGWTEGVLKDLPFSAGVRTASDEARSAALNSAAARSIGQTGNELTEGTLAAARRDIGQQFDNIFQRQLIPGQERRFVFGPEFQRELAQVQQSQVMPALRNDSIQQLITSLQPGLPGGRFTRTGEWIQQNKTALDGAIRDAHRNNQTGLANSLQGVEDALMNNVRRQLLPGEQAAFNQAERQWANLRTLETGQAVKAGNVDPNAVKGALERRYGVPAVREGRLTGELADIARLGGVYKQLPQSGTVPRSVYTGAVTGLGGLGTLASTSYDPTTRKFDFEIPYGKAALAMAAPWLAQRALGSRILGNYAAGGMRQVTPELERRLRQGGLLLSAPFISNVD